MGTSRNSYHKCAGSLVKVLTLPSKSGRKSPTSHRWPGPVFRPGCRLGRVGCCRPAGENHPNTTESSSPVGIQAEAKGRGYTGLLLSVICIFLLAVAIGHLPFSQRTAGKEAYSDRRFCRVERTCSVTGGCQMNHKELLDRCVICSVPLKLPGCRSSGEINSCAGWLWRIEPPPRRTG